MGNELKKVDFLTFFKRNSKIIIIISATLSVIIMGLFLIMTFNSNGDDDLVTDQTATTQETSIDNLLARDIDELTMEESYRIEEFLSQGAFQFSMFIENEDSTSFNRSNLLKEFLTQEEVVNDIESNLGFTLHPSAEQIIDVNFNGNNVLMTVTISTGDFVTSEEIANEYYNYIEDGNLSLLNNRQVYFLNLPQPVDQEDIDVSGELEGEAASQDSSTLNNIFTIIIGLIFSIVFGSILAILGIALTLPFSKNISALFNYEIQDVDLVVNLLNEHENKEKSILHAILYPTMRRKLLLVENNSTLNKFSNLIKEHSSKDDYDNDSLVFATSVSEVSPKYNFEEIVIISEIGHTTKKWYKEQSNQLKMYHSPKKIIKI